MEFARASHTRRGPGTLPSSGSRPVRTPAPIAPTLDGRAMSPESLLEVQHRAGNRAATAIVQRQPGGAVASERRTLRFGSTGEDVKQLQMKLHKLREREHDRDEQRRARIDGIFGPLTREDVIDFQTDTGLDADGIVGPRTWDALDTLVPGTPDEGTEQVLNDRFGAALALEDSGQYDAALAEFEAIVAVSTTPEMGVTALANVGVCHQQRGRFGLAVARYEQALAARFNQESIRSAILGDLEKARRNEFRDQPPPDPEPLPPGADAATAAGREGGGVTEREPVKSGDSGPAVDLYKGKLAHMMVAWDPELPEGDVFDGPTAARTRAFQEVCGLTQTGEADPSTWHALDSFTRADVPFSIVNPLFQRARTAGDILDADPAASLPLFLTLRDEARSLGLVEVVKTVELQIGRAHHRMSQFTEAVSHYELYLARNIPNPPHYGQALELLRLAHAGLPAD